jgi:glycosyltransferase involved in cell wall biosynthesis
MRTVKKLNLVLNAIPLLNISTGIGRYLDCLYSQLEKQFNSEIEFGYFNGISLLKHPPRGPSNLNQWSSKVDFFWKLPTLPALCLRLASHVQRELFFRKVAEGAHIYHEASFFPFFPLNGAKTAFTLHDLSLIRFPEFHPKERVLYAKLFWRRRCRLVDQFVTDSQFIKDEIVSCLGVEEKRVRVIHLAHDSRIFYPRAQREIEQTRARYAIPDKYVMTVGSGDPRKNMDIIPAALVGSGLSTPLVVVGWSGWSEAKIRDSNSIQVGYVPDEDLAALYTGAQALIYPSLYEGFGLPVLEAMACGCPVICSRRASLPEVAGEAALYLENPYDSRELGDLLRQVSSEPSFSGELSQKGMERASLFSWEKAAIATFKIFKDLR